VTLHDPLRELPKRLDAPILLPPHRRERVGLKEEGKRRPRDRALDTVDRDSVLRLVLPATGLDVVGYRRREKRPKQRRSLNERNSIISSSPPPQLEEMEVNVRVALSLPPVAISSASPVWKARQVGGMETLIGLLLDRGIMKRPAFS
jgi:hypothetical protein